MGGVIHVWVREAYFKVTEETLQHNETMKARYEQQWRQLDLVEVVSDEIPDLERRMRRHRREEMSLGDPRDHPDARILWICALLGPLDTARREDGDGSLIRVPFRQLLAEL